MSSRTRTPELILEASRKLFNQQGYAATSLSEIAAAVGISQGNLTYHFPSKSDLAVRIIQDVRGHVQTRRARRVIGEIPDDYVDHLVFGMRITWANRFLLRDRMHFKDKVGSSEAYMMADFEDLHGLLKRVDAEGMFRAGAVDDLEVLARSIWVMSRYWMDYLRELEGLEDICWADQERGIEHHFAILLPCLKESAKRAFREALKRARSVEIAIERRALLE